MPQANKTGKRPGTPEPVLAAAARAAPGVVKADAQNVRIPERLHGEVHVRADTLDEENRTVEIVWAEGAKVKRYDWYEGGYYIEELSMDPAHIRTVRFDTGMSLLDSHSSYTMDDRLGTVVPGSVRIEGGKGYATVKLSRKQRAEELLQDLRDGHSFPVSVGYKTHAYEKTEGDGDTLPVLRAIDWEPFELSAVPVPADPGAHALRSEDAGPVIDVAIARRPSQNSAGTARNGESTMPQPNQTGRKPGETNNPNGNRSDDAAGGDDDTVAGGDDEQPAGDDTVAGGDESRAAPRAPLQPQAGEPGAPATRNAPVAPAADPSAAQREMQAASRQAVADERQRNADIASVGRRMGMSDDAIRKAQTDGTTLEAFREAAVEEMIKRQESNPTFPHGIRMGQDEVDTRRAAVANAILHRFGIVNELTPAARASGYREMSGMDIAKELLRERGESVRGSVNDVATRAFHTTSDFPAILADVTNQTVLAGYAEYENTFGLISTRNVVSDFREIKTLEIGDTPDLLKVNEHGEFKRGTMRESTEAFKIETYGRIIGFTRQMLINDQLNAFVRAATEQGRKVAKLEGDVVWSVIIKNMKLSDGTPIFDVSRGNTLADGTALNLEALKLARTAFRKLKSLDGEPINLPPRYLFVGTELEIMAQVILTGVLNNQTIATVVPDAIKSLTPVYEHRLDALGEFAWLLLADPAATGGRGVQHAYLAGQEQPFYESRVGFDVDGVEYKVRHDFGAGVTDYRFGYLNPGAAPADGE